MEHALVVMQADYDPTDIVREAGELAAGVGAELTLFYVTSEETYRQKRDALTEYADHADTRYNIDDALTGAENFAKDIATSVLSDMDITINTAASFGELDEEALNYARGHDIDHIFIAGRERSPVGKAVFGDEAQNVILNFDGATTIFTQ